MPEVAWTKDGETKHPRFRTRTRAKGHFGQSQLCTPSLATEGVELT